MGIIFNFEVLLLKMGRIGCLETSVTKDKSMLHNIHEDQVLIYTTAEVWNHAVSQSYVRIQRWVLKPAQWWLLLRKGIQLWCAFDVSNRPDVLCEV
jgi:hypothetical protein